MLISPDMSQKIHNGLQAIGNKSKEIASQISKAAVTVAEKATPIVKNAANTAAHKTLDFALFAKEKTGEAYDIAAPAVKTASAAVINKTKEIARAIPPAASHAYDKTAAALIALKDRVKAKF